MAQREHFTNMAGTQENDMDDSNKRNNGSRTALSPCCTKVNRIPSGEKLMDHQHQHLSDQHDQLTGAPVQAHGSGARCQNDVLADVCMSTGDVVHSTGENASHIDSIARKDEGVGMHGDIKHRNVAQSGGDTSKPTLPPRPKMHIVVPPRIPRAQYLLREAVSRAAAARYHEKIASAKRQRCGRGSGSCGGGCGVAGANPRPTKRRRHRCTSSDGSKKHVSWAPDDKLCTYTPTCHHHHQSSGSSASGGGGSASSKPWVVKGHCNASRMRIIGKQRGVDGDAHSSPTTTRDTNNNHNLNNSSSGVRPTATPSNDRVVKQRRSLQSPRVDYGHCASSTTLTSFSPHHGMHDSPMGLYSPLTSPLTVIPGNGRGEGGSTPQYSLVI